MLPHKQTITYAGADWRERGITPGNCFQTAVASLLDLPVDEVPHFVADLRPGPGWWEAARTWARETIGKDFSWNDLPLCDTARAEIVERNLWGGLVIAGGKTVRGTDHVVLVRADDLTLAHDPHPSDAGLIEIEDLWWFSEPYDPTPAEQYAGALSSAAQS